MENNFCVDRVEQLARERGLSVTAFCQLCEICESTVRKAKSRRADLTLSTIRSICRGAGISLAEFFQNCEK